MTVTEGYNMKRHIIPLLACALLMSSCRYTEPSTEISAHMESRPANDNTSGNDMSKNDVKTYYSLPGGLSFAERDYEKSYRRYLKRNYTDWEERWQYHLKKKYYDEPDYDINSSWEHSDENDDENPEKQESEEEHNATVDAGVVDFNMFY